MDKKENNNPMLSFDKLREGLGIEGDLPQVNEPQRPKTVDEVKPISKNVTPTSGKSVVENGIKFIDITEQYTSPQQQPVIAEETPVKQEEKVEQVVIPVPETPKKRVRTFNEIFSDFFSVFLPVKGDSSKEIIRKIIMDFSIILIIACLIGFVQLFVERTEQSALGGSVNNTDLTDRLSKNSYNESWKETLSDSATITFPEGMKSQFSYLYSSNNDMAGWLKISNTSLDVQVVQGNDNEYYQNKDFYGNDSNSGCPYVDYKNETIELDDNTIIYGQNSNNNLMFSVLEQYKTIEGYKKSPIIEFSTLYKSYTFKVFAVFIATDSPVSDNGFSYTVTDFMSDNKFGEFINEVKSRSLINTDVSVQTDDKILTLVTPTREFDNARLVVMGRMVRENESTDVNVDAVTLNTSPKYPQAWYDKKGESNPFA
ncbi:MAG: class B sortase [Clostridia bacterium]|nr:class B sortase [Clostridia bacterium]